MLAWSSGPAAPEASSSRSMTYSSSRSIQCLRGEGLDQVVQHPAGHRAPDRVELPGRGDHEDIHRPPAPAQPLQDVQAGHVRQMNVQQHQLRAQLRGQIDALLPGVGHGHDVESAACQQEPVMDPGHCYVIVNDEGAYGAHCFCSSASFVLSTTEKQAPPNADEETAARPPRRRATRWTRASPNPRLLIPSASLLVTPGSNTLARSAPGRRVRRPPPRWSARRRRSRPAGWQQCCRSPRRPQRCRSGCPGP